MNDSIKKHILKSLESQPERAFRLYEIVTLINDIVTPSVNVARVRNLLGELTTQQEISCTENGHYKFKSREATENTRYFLAPHIIDALRKSGRIFSQDINTIIRPNPEGS